MGRIKGKQFGGIGDLKKKTDFYIAHSAHEFLLSGKAVQFSLGSLFSVRKDMIAFPVPRCYNYDVR